MSVGPPVLRYILCDNCSFSGGTKTSVVLLSPCGEVLSEVEGPASNLFVCAPSSLYEKLKKTKKKQTANLKELFTYV